MGEQPNERYYVDPCGGRGWPKSYIIVDRSTVPHTVPTLPYKISSKASATKLCATLNEQATEWKLPPTERDSLPRLREWAARSKAFTERAYDPDAAPALVVPEAA